MSFKKPVLPYTEDTMQKFTVWRVNSTSNNIHANISAFRLAESMSINPNSAKIWIFLCAERRNKCKKLKLKMIDKYLEKQEQKQNGGHV